MVRMLTLAAGCILAVTSATYAQDQCPEGRNIITMAFERAGQTVGYVAVDTQSDLAFWCHDAQNTWTAGYAEAGDGGFAFSLKSRNGTWPRAMKPNSSGVVEDRWHSGGRPFRMFVVENRPAQ